METLNRQRISWSWPASNADESFYGGQRRRRLNLLTLTLVCLFGISESNCGHAGTPSSAQPSPPSVTVTIAPASANLFLGTTEQFQANIAGSSNASVMWEVNGVAGGAANTGTISEAGLYTAPPILPSVAGVSVTAVSQADSQASGSAAVSLVDNIVVTVSPGTASVSPGSAQEFTASISATGNPAANVTWSVNGIAGGDSTAAWE